MFQLISFVKNWASVYKPMLHGSKDKRGRVRKRFFCIENIGQIANFAKDLAAVESPFVAIETNIGGNISDRYVYPEYNVYFFVMGAGKMLNNEEEDTAVKLRAMQHALSFLAYLKHYQEQASSGQAMLDGIHTVDTDNARFETFGPFMNRWFCVGISLFGLEKIACINSQDYIEQGGSDETD